MELISSIVKYLPDGWTAEFFYRAEERFVVITRPGNERASYGVMATLDLKERVYRAGMVTHGPKTGPKHIRFIGRNWRKLLVEHAVRFLQEL